MGLFTRDKPEPIFQPVNGREAAFLATTEQKQVEPQGAKSFIYDTDTSTLGWDGTWGWGSDYALLYRRQPAVRTVVDFLSRNIAQLTLKTYMRIGNDDRMELDDHDLAQLLRAPNPTTSRSDFMRDTVADKALYDRAYWRLDQPLFPRALMRIPPSRIARRITNGKSFEYYGPDGKLIPRDELVVFSGYSPEGAWDNEDGVSPLETLRRTLAEEFASQDNRANFWNNAARQAGVIERPLDAPEWSNEARARFRSEWQNAMTGGANSGKTGILEEGMVWKSDAFSPKDSEYIAGRKLTRDEVAMQYGIPPKLLGADDLANANLDSFHRQLYQDTFGPWLKSFQDTIELQLLPVVDTSDTKTRARIYVEFNLAAKLAGSFEEQARTLTTSVGVPWMAGNEARARLNLPRIDDPDFDIPVKPLNVMYGGQPAVTIPTEVPQPKGQKRRKATAPRGVITRRDDAAKAHTELFRRYFKSQQRAMKSKATPVDTETWNQKLTGQLFASTSVLASKTGALAARQLDGVYDASKTHDFLIARAAAQAEAVNKQTAAALAAAEDADAEARVFEIATTSRAEYLGLSTATAVIAFARTEAGKQSQAADGRQRMKTWVVTSKKSRHPQLDGESVGVDEDFSNGLPWPGAGDADESAGCQCLLDMDVA